MNRTGSGKNGARNITTPGRQQYQPRKHKKTYEVDFEIILHMAGRKKNTPAASGIELLVPPNKLMGKRQESIRLIYSSKNYVAIQNLGPA